MIYTKQNYSEAPLSFLIERLNFFLKYLETWEERPYSVTYMPGCLTGFSSWQEEYLLVKDLIIEKLNNL